MKTKTKSRKALFTTDSEAGFLIAFIILTLFALALTSCSKDDEPVEPDTRAQFVGEYAVEDISTGTGNEYSYDVTISIGSGGDLEISNFGDVMNVPVKATAQGSSLTIKSQTFTNPSGKKLTITGSGSLANNVLTFTYTLSGFVDYSGNCKANRK